MRKRQTRVDDRGLKAKLGVFDLEEVRAAYGFNIATLRRYVRERKLKARLIGRKYYVAEPELRRFFGSAGTN